jgi:hypothetical protein
VYKSSSSRLPYYTNNKAFASVNIIIISNFF